MFGRKEGGTVYPVPCKRMEQMKIKSRNRNTTKAETKDSENVLKIMKNDFSFQILRKSKPLSEKIHHCYIMKVKLFMWFQGNFEVG